MTLFKIPAAAELQDEQFIQVEGPDQLTTGFQYDAQLRALYFKESQTIFPSFHGATHIAEDPIPSATCDTPGLMAADDKCKLDAVLQTRLGVLGFMGAGFPDDGGWMQGDTILAAGSEFISIERIGNVIRFTVDLPTPFSCGCESCQQIFWVQDETALASIRPPTCAGKLPGINAYGEFKIYAFPESTIVDPNNPATTLARKDRYPALLFKRYANSVTPGSAEFDLILKRNSANTLQTEIGWSFTPGAGSTPECIWFVGKDNNGNQLSFELDAKVEPGLLGAVLYNGHLITKKMAVIVDYTSTILSTNHYACREWDVDQNRAIGDTFSVRNVWQYSNPERPISGSNPQRLVLDATIDLIPIGTLVDLWSFKVGEVSGEPILRHYFSKKPTFNPLYLWSWHDSVQFGDVTIAKEEVQPGPGSEDKTAYVQQSAIRNFERDQWGLTGYQDPLLSFDVASTAGTEAADLTVQHRALIDTSIPALAVVEDESADGDYSERPVYLWNRRELANSILRVDLGRPGFSRYSPYDVIIRGYVDEHVERYLKVIGKGEISGLNYIRVKGVHFHDLPPFGTVRILHPSENRNLIFNYSRKFVFPTFLDTTAPDDDFDSVVLAGDSSQNSPYLGEIGDVVELLHQEYNNQVVRVEFSYNSATGLVQVQFKVGMLDMSLPYEQNISSDADDFVRGLAPGYAVSAIYSQTGTFTGVGTQPASSLDGFVIYDGGAVDGGVQSEYWNRLEIMNRDNQIWIWWNQILVPPSTTLSAALSTPVSVDTPYFPTVSGARDRGKVGVRLWPGSKLRRFDIRTQNSVFSEYQYGQLSIT